MDLSRADILKDSNALIDIETHFKLVAGPGAGKTRFLINHIKNVITNSQRLTKVKKIACITYTNIGVETIVERLENSMGDVEVSTIHSFLYKHVIKPYLWVLNDEFEIALADIDGHDEIIPTYSLLEEWVNDTGQQFLLYDHEADLRKELMNLRWVIQYDELKLQRKYFDLPITNSSLIKYKEICWKKALISHDDVLFLSYKILIKKNRILEILRAKFPYIFVDEFQDTNPIQSEILKMIGEKETVIGVIGDPGQSIFAFQGADVQKFVDFDLKNIELFKLENNHRSTEEIISILNHVRDESNFIQVSPENKTGNPPQIIVGGFFEAYKKAMNISEDKNICSLTFKNEISNIMKFGSETYFESEDINNPLSEDSNSDRAWQIRYTITAIEYCKQNKIKDAVNYMKKAYRKSNNFSDEEALENLKRLIDDYDKFKEGSIKDFYNNYLFDHYGVKSKITRSHPNDYYKSRKYKQIAVTVKINDDDSLHRTIHKSKGDEFNSVLLIIPSKGDFNESRKLEFLLKPDIGKEKNRRYYVALSRAIQNLFINVPKLSEDNETKLKQICFEIVRLNNN